MSAPSGPVPLQPSRTSSPAPAPQQPTNQQKWHALLSHLLTNPIPPGHDTAPIPAGTHFDIHAPIHEAFNAGLLSGTGAPTTYTDITILEAVDCQRRYFQYGLHRGIIQRLAALAPTQMVAAPPPATPPTQQDRAPKLNPPKPFDGTRAEYKSFIMQLNLIFNSDPARYTGTNADNAKIAYAASFLSGSAKEWFQPHVNETTGVISFPTWTDFVAALRAAFEDPDAYQTAYNKISTLKQEKDCSSYYASFVSLATVLGIDERTKISFFKKGLHAELKKALSYQITLPTGFEEFVQACIKIDNQIRANREARDAIPRTQGGQFAPTPSTSTGTHSGPMDLSGARYRSQKRGPVTDQEKKRRRDNNLCLYCGSSGHWASQCPHKRSRGKPSAAAAATSEGGVHIPPAVPVLSSASVAPAQVLYEAKN